MNARNLLLAANCEKNLLRSTGGATAPSVEHPPAVHHQRLAGTLSLGGVLQPLLGARIDGDQLMFSFVDREGRLQPVRARIEAHRLHGELLAPYGSHDVPMAPTPFEGARIDATR